MFNNDVPPCTCGAIKNLMEVEPTQSDTEYGTFFPSCHSARSLSQQSQDWIIDSGATDHIVSSPKFFDKSSSKSSFVNLPNGSSVGITSVGSIELNSNLPINNVLCVPSFRVNLLSVSKLTRQLHCTILFHPDFCVLQDLATKKVIGIGKHHNGLYYLSQNTAVQPPPVTHNVSVTHDLWHRRLGHPSTAPSQFLEKSTSGITFDFNSHCDVCPMAKQTRLSFPLSSISTSAPFDLIHCDIWGPHREPSHTDACYFLTIVDDFS